MYGAIIGDLAGSTYEYDQTKGVHPVVKNELIEENSFYSDDTILTVAVLDAILNGRNYDHYLREYAKKYKDYKPDFNPYFKTSFSPHFMDWALNGFNRFSTGNGAMMRISSVGYLFNDKDSVLNNAYFATVTSHDSFEAVYSARMVAYIIYLARCGLSKEQIKDKLNIDPQYKEFTRFNSTCHETLNNCLYALFSSNSYEESVLKVISYGGDTDTNACIVGSMAESLYGLDPSLISAAKEKIPSEFVDTLDFGYKLIKKIK